MTDNDPSSTFIASMQSAALIKRVHEIEREGNSKELPKWLCHKTVWALKIADIKDTAEPGDETDGSKFLLFEDSTYAPIRVDYEFIRKHKPEAGGYYVVYTDGYRSFSPSKAFEDGYTRIP